MSKARDISNLFSASTSAATDAEVTSAVSTHASNTTNRHYQTGTTANRPGSPNIGDLYFDTTLDRLISYTSAGWKQVLEIPDIPTNVVATLSGNTGASISFTAPTNVPVMSYLVTSSPGNITSSGSASPIIISGLTKNTSYTFSIVAQGYNGNSQSVTTNSITTPNTVSVNYLIIAGGGGGGGWQGAGAGAGGYRTSFGTSGGNSSAETAFDSVIGTSYTVTVGAGGTGGAYANPNSGTQGNNSVFGSLTSLGGARGPGYPSGQNGFSGGSGSGGNGVQVVSTGGAGTSGQGFAGGNTVSSAYATAGGGGAGAIGGNSSGAGTGGAGGAGLASNITGSSVTRGGGGGGHGQDSGGAGGAGGGGAGSTYVNAPSSGSTNTGGGGGGARDGNGASGGSGIVIIRASQAAVSTTGSPTYTTPSGSHVYVFTASGSITF